MPTRALARATVQIVEREFIGSSDANATSVATVIDWFPDIADTAPKNIDDLGAIDHGCLFTRDNRMDRAVISSILRKHSSFDDNRR